MFKKFCVFCVLAAGISGGVAAQQRDRQSLDKINLEIERKRKEAARLEAESKKLDSEIRSTQKKLVDVAANIQRHERQIAEHDRRLAELRARERELNRTIEGNNAELVKIIAVFENMSQAPKGYLLAAPEKIENVFQTSLLLRAIVEQLDGRRVQFRRDLAEMSKLEAEIAKNRRDTAAVATRVRAEKTRMDSLVKAKQAQHRQANQRTASTQAEIRRLVTESRTIEEFLKKAEELRRRQEAQVGARPSPTVSRRFAGRVPLPVTGRIVTYFGDKRATGITSNGLYIQSRQGAQVISPADASVVFSGSFYGYRNLLILRNTDGYYVIMGGMERVFAEEGQSLLAGEPIGEAGGENLYVEVRESERLINPATYFRL